MLLWGGIVVLMIALFSMSKQNAGTTEQEISYSDFMHRVSQGEIQKVTIQGQNIVASSGGTGVKSEYKTYMPQEDPSLMPKLLQSNIDVKVMPPEESSWFVSALVMWLPLLLILGFWVYTMRQAQGGGSRGPMAFGRARTRMLNQEGPKVTFDDVAGVDEAKEELTEIVDFLSDPRRFTRLGGRIPKGVLLVGPPGTGKTLLARAVAGEAGVPFFSISGSDFVEMFVGVGASRVRDLFVQGKRNAPCLIFIDEIDAVGRQRGAGLGGGHDEREQTLNQLLVEMDGFESNEGVILIAATNRPDVLDPALLRPGRFDRQVVVPTPDMRGRERILEVHSGKTPLGNDVNLEVIAKGTPGFSGADLENLVNEAALQAAKSNKNQVSMADFEFAKDKVLMGRERRSLLLSDEEKRTTAYHEAGHALVAKLLPGTDPVHKVSIIPRGRALGVTMQLPEGDRHGYSRNYLLNNLAVLLSGRVAESLVFGDITTGAGNDIERASKLARKMVCEWGMSDSIGPMAVGDQHDEVFLGRELMHARNYSEETARLVDNEVKRLIHEARDKVEVILREQMDLLHKIAEVLLDRETISGDDMDVIMREVGVEPVTVSPKSMQIQAKEARKPSGEKSGHNRGDGHPESYLSQDETDEPTPQSADKAYRAMQDAPSAPPTDADNDQVRFSSESGRHPSSDDRPGDNSPDDAEEHSGNQGKRKDD